MITAARFTIRQADGVVVTGPVQGCGGIIDDARGLGRFRLQAAINRVTDGNELRGLYEPQPGHVRMYPEYSAQDRGRDVDVNLRGAVLL